MTNRIPWSGRKRRIFIVAVRGGSREMSGEKVEGELLQIVR